MENWLRMLGEFVDEGFAYGTLSREPERDERVLLFNAINPMFAEWLGVSDCIDLRRSGIEILEYGDMLELYQPGEIQEVISTGVPSHYKIYNTKHQCYFKVFLWKKDHDGFAMLIKQEKVNVPHVHQAVRLNRQQAEEGLKFLIDHMADVLWRVDSDFRFLYISASDTLMRGYQSEEVLGHTLWDFLTPEGTEAVLRLHRNCVHRGTTAVKDNEKPIEIQMICKDGRLIWAETILTPVFDQKGQFDGYQAVTRNITERRKSQNTLVEYKKLMEDVLDNMAQAMVVVNSRLEIAAYNKKFLDMFSFQPGEIYDGIPFEESFKTWKGRRESNRNTTELDPATVFSGASFVREFWYVQEEKEKRWMQMFHNPLPGGGFVRTYTDITERKRYELDLYASHEKLAAIAAIDELTGALNRRSGFDELKMLERSCMEDNKPFSICFLDIDNLKMVNDQYGHNEGDDLLMTVVDVIKTSIRNVDSVCRMGGDEFMILLPGCYRGTAEALIERIRDNLKKYSEDSDKLYDICFSCGIEQMIPEDPRSMEELIDSADAEMYRNKKEKKRKKHAN